MTQAHEEIGQPSLEARDGEVKRFEHRKVSGVRGGRAQVELRFVHAGLAAHPSQVRMQKTQAALRVMGKVMSNA
ncbi:MAG TPA: hypothetical protein VHG72_11715 [Polyangia bacterium]|nr:hypothetical protein [Polyangia bacterium]